MADVDPVLRYFAGLVDAQDGAQMQLSLFVGGQWVRGVLIGHVAYFDELGQSLGARINDPAIAESWRAGLREAATIIRGDIDQALADETEDEDDAASAAPALDTILNLRDVSVCDARGQWQKVGYWRVSGAAVAAWSIGW